MAIETVRAGALAQEAALAERLAERITRAKRRVLDSGRAQYACATVEFTRQSAWYAQLLQARGVASWFLRTPDGALTVACDTTLEVIADGADRFEVLRTAWADCRTRVIADGADVVRFLFGFSFAHRPLTDAWEAWPNAVVTLPRILFFRAADGVGVVTLSVEVSEDTDEVDAVQRAVADFAKRVAEADGAVGGSPLYSPRPVASVPYATPASTTKAEHGRMVTDTVADIRAGRYEKAVVARQFVTEASGLNSVVAATATLCAAYPDNTIFTVTRGGETYLGASPERLVSTRRGQVLVDCLAGTTKRGQSAEEDAAFGYALAHSPKNLHEHRVVVHAIMSQLKDFAMDVQLDVDHDLVRLPNVQHLYSRVSGGLRQGVTLLDLAARLHPTPATAGQPTDAALSAILEREPFARGWYAGGIGALDAGGDGTIFVALRSALVGQQCAILYAGGGIMEDSEAEAEWAETELKLRPMRMALGLDDGSDGGDGVGGQ